MKGIASLDATVAQMMMSSEAFEEPANRWRMRKAKPEVHFTAASVPITFSLQSIALALSATHRLPVATSNFLERAWLLTQH